MNANDLQTKISIFNVLFDIYKILSIELHRRNFTSFVTSCPTCTDGYLMKVEFQSLIDSIHELLPFNNLLIDGDDDPLRFEKMLPGCMTFMETQSGDRNFVQSFITQADISRLSSDCDLVPATLQSSNYSSHHQESRRVQRRLVSSMKVRPGKKMHVVLNNLSNRCLTIRTTKLRASFVDSNDDASVDEKMHRLDEHLSSDGRYNPPSFSKHWR